MMHMIEGEDNCGAIGLLRDVRRSAERSARTLYIRAKDILYQFTIIKNTTMSENNTKQNGKCK